MCLVSMANDIIELMNSLSIASAYFVGHSLGGKVAMQLAMNSPDRVKFSCCRYIASKIYR